MNIDDLLADPETHEPLRRASHDELERVVRALTQGRARRHDGRDVSLDIRGAYVSHGGRWVYPDADGIPSLLVDERIELDQPL